jgi:two-component system, sensor histidine kinase and response regulator
MRVLVVDDEMAIREGCRRALTAKGLEAEVAENGPAGLRRLSEGSFEILLVDAMMPGMSGLEMLQEARKLSPEIIAIIITGYATVELAVQAMREGAHDFLAKPFSPALMLQVIHRAVEHERLRREAQRVKDLEAEKLASLGRLAASIAHEVNNPLSGVLIYTELLSKKISRGDINKEGILDYLSKMNFELTRSTRLIQSLLDFAKQSELKLERVEINRILNQALDISMPAGSGNLIQVEKELQALPEVIADPALLEQVFINLILNALQAMAERGKMTLRTYAEDQEVKIAVQDTGCGIPPENLNRLFTPFFSTKKEVKGVGLGLPVSYGIIQRHHGRIEVKSKLGEGSTFTICLPVSLPL